MDKRCPHYQQPLNYEAFLTHHLLPNIPAVFGAPLVERWEALKDWTCSGCTHESRSPNWSFFKNRFGSDDVSVADCSTMKFGDQCRMTMSISNLMDILTTDDGAKQLYLKDWHLRQRHPEYKFYQTPDLFRDDWMNDYYLNGRDTTFADDFRFVYMGKSGTFTPLHRDVYCSYSWSTNVIGRKRWTLFPPHVTDFLYNPPTSRKDRVYDVRDVDNNKFPRFQEAMQEAIVVEQSDGETIFVPSGWYHQVENTSDCISINHNWANSNCVINMYNAMCTEVGDVVDALADVEEMIRDRWRREGKEGDGWRLEWISVVQDVVTKNAGWGWYDFWAMLLHAANGKSHRSEDNTGSVECPNWITAPTHLQPPQKQDYSIIALLLQRFKAERQEWPLIEGLPSLLEDLQTVLEG